MRFLKTYKLFESFNQVDILFDLNDIFVDLEDSDFIVNKATAIRQIVCADLIMRYRWFDYFIKEYNIFIKDSAGDYKLKDFKEMRGFQFLLDVNLDNFDEIKSTLIRAIRYIREANKSKFFWNTRIYYSYSENTDNMKNMFEAFNLTAMEDDELDKLISGLKIEGTSYSYEQVPKRIKINIHKD